MVRAVILFMDPDAGKPVRLLGPAGLLTLKPFMSCAAAPVYGSRNSSAFGFAVTSDAHKMLQSRILALIQLAKSHTERFYSRNRARPNCYRKSDAVEKRLNIADKSVTIDSEFL